MEQMTITLTLGTGETSTATLSEATIDLLLDEAARGWSINGYLPTPAEALARLMDTLAALSARSPSEHICYN